MKKQYLKYLALLSFISACSNANSGILEGTVKVKGSAPHTYIVIEDSKTNKDYKISNSTKFNLNSMQNRAIKAKVKLIKKPQGPGFPALVEILELTK